MHNLAIEPPFFIVGSGRSGSSILYQLLAVHPQLCWVSRLTDRFPWAPWLSRAHRLLDLPVMGPALKRRIVRRGAWWLTPLEGVRTFEHHVGLRSDRRSTEDDYDASVHARFEASVAGHVAGSGKQRFLCKRTANAQRIRLLNRMFPEAMFLHLIRDGRAVAHSLTRVPWWDDVDVWWLGQRPPQWRAAGRSDLELMALHWRRDTQEALDAAGVLGSRYHEIRYEDLTRDTHAVLRTICEFAGFSFPSDYSALVPSTLPDMNHKWRQTLSHAELDIIFEAAGELLEALGYSRE